MAKTIMRKQRDKMVAIYTGAFKDMQSRLPSGRANRHADVKIREGEDIAFGSLAFFLDDSKPVRARRHRFYQY